MIPTLIRTYNALCILYRLNQDARGSGTRRVVCPATCRHGTLEFDATGGGTVETFEGPAGSGDECGAGDEGCGVVLFGLVDPGFGDVFCANTMGEFVGLGGGEEGLVGWIVGT